MNSRPSLLPSLLLLLFSLVSVPITIDAVSPPSVTVKQGVLSGRLIQVDAFRAHAYLGIPFAAAPVGELRFEKPKPAPEWEGVRDATAFGAGCLQLIPPANQVVGNVSEDCLFLNVFTPVPPKAPLQTTTVTYPVMVYIHGGGYSVGSSRFYRPDAVVDRLVREGIVVVTISYRIGPLGFFTVGSEPLAGNLGLYDQIAALQWIKENIEAFGGDRQHITVAGLSAGAGAVSQLALSPLAQDLFDATIEMSGSAWNPWATSDSVVENSRQLARAIDCQPDGCPFKLKNCLKNKSMEEIYKGLEKIKYSEYMAWDALKFHPNLDGKLLKESLESMVSTTRRRPALIGLSSAECSYFVTFGLSAHLVNFSISPSDYENWTVDRLHQLILTNANKFYGEKLGKHAAEKILGFYVNQSDGGDIDDYRYILKQYVKLASDLFFNVGVVEGALQRAIYGSDVFLYHFERNNPELHVAKGNPVMGSPHANEYAYLYDLFLITKFDTNNEDDLAVRATFLSSIVNFVKHYNPKRDGWTPIRQDQPLNYLAIDVQSEIRNGGYYELEYAFWKQIMPSFGGVDVTLQIDKKRSRKTSPHHHHQHAHNEL